MHLILIRFQARHGRSHHRVHALCHDAGRAIQPVGRRQQRVLPGWYAPGAGGAAGAC